MALSDFSEKLSNIVKVLPNKPGVYQYFDADGKIIYVGKAKDLKKRVSSYFNKDQTQSGKVQVLVKRIRDIRFIVTNSEGEALLLENNLIKEFQPRYNILLKDDKTYPWIILKKEPFPRIFYTRNKIKDGSEYFGPFASVKSMHTLLELVHQTYPLRNCSLNLAQKYIDEGKYKVCLQYHIGKCLGPCQGLQSKENYNGLVRAAREIIKGNISGVKAQLKEEMMAFAEKMEFEKAQYIKEKIERLENYQAKSVVVNPLISNVDVFSILSDEKSAFVNYLKVEAGAVIQAYTLELKKKLEESDEELLLLAVTELRSRFESTSTEVILPFQPETELPGITLTVPQRGDKKSLLELSERNAKYFRLEQEKQKDLVDPDRHGKRIIKQMQSDLRMPVAPDHIECFDNSNTQGSYPVASMVVFKNAKPDKKEYRHFNIKTVEGPNDFASMEEIITRRYSRLLDEQKPLPQLIIVDGGKGQLSSAVGALDRIGLRGKITIIGIAKRLEEIYFPEDSIPLYIDKKSETLRIIQQLRDEAHRFGITHHRKRREKGTIKTELTSIPGIGTQTATLLLAKFRSIKRIKEANTEELINVIGQAKTALIQAYFSKSQNQEK